MRFWTGIVLGLGIVGQGCASARGRVDMEASRVAYQEGLTAYQATQYKEAIEKLDGAVAENPNNHDALTLRGMARMRQIDKGDGSRYLDETQKAFEDFNAAIRIYPLNFHGYYHRAVALASVHRYDDAARDLLNHCLSLRPDDAAANLLLAKVYDDGFVGQGKRALQYYEKYARLAGVQVEPWVLARIRELQSSLSATPAPGQDEQKAAQLFEAAMAHVAQKNYSEAIKLLTELQTKFSHTQIAKNNERMLPLVIQAMKGEGPKDGKN